VVTYLLKRLGDKRYRWGFAGGHLVFVVAVLLVVCSGPDDAQAGLLWLVPLAVDFPVSRLLLCEEPQALEAEENRKAL